MSVSNCRGNPVRRQPIHQRPSRGFSLIEVLVAVLVLAIGLLGLAAMQGVSVQGNHSAYMRTQASYLAYEIIDAMRSNREAALDGDYDLTLAANPPDASSTATSDVDLRAWRGRVTDLLPSGRSSVATAAGQITVIVEWDDSRAVQGAQQFSVQTQL